jgi:Ca2+/Na+ antiporter
LRKYGLKDIKKKELFMLLNILFMIDGVVAILSLLYGGLKIVTGISWVIAMVLGYIIFRMVKESGTPSEEKDEEKIEEKKEKED